MLPPLGGSSCSPRVSGCPVPCKVRAHHLPDSRRSNVDACAAQRRFALRRTVPPSGTPLIGHTRLDCRDRTLHPGLQYFSAHADQGEVRLLAFSACILLRNKLLKQSTQTQPNPTNHAVAVTPSSNVAVPCAPVYEILPWPLPLKLQRHIPGTTRGSLSIHIVRGCKRRSYSAYTQRSSGQRFKRKSILRSCVSS